MKRRKKEIAKMIISGVIVYGKSVGFKTKKVLLCTLTEINCSEMFPRSNYGHHYITQHYRRQQHQQQRQQQQQ